MRFLFFFLAFVVFPLTARAADSLSVVPEAAYATAAGHVLRGDYAAAEAVLDSFMRAEPEEPAGPLLKAAILQYEHTEYEDAARKDEFAQLLDRARELAVSHIERNPDDLWARYFRAAADGLDGAWAVLADSRLRGFLQGRAGAAAMSEIIRADSTFYDACLMRGSYRFWRSRAFESVTWLPFMGDETAEGIADVRLAVARGRLSGPLANTVLLEILLDADPAAAAVEGAALLETYPDCRLFAWQVGEAYKKLGRWEDAVRVFTALAAAYESDSRDDGSGPLRCWWKLAVLAKTVGKPDECVYYCGKVIAIADKSRDTRFLGRNAERIAAARSWVAGSLERSE